MLRIVWVGSNKVYFVIPGIVESYWDNPVSVLKSDLPEGMLQKLTTGYRCYAQVKLLNENPLDVEIRDWE